MSDVTKKRGLGRGLDALFQGVKDEEDSFQPRRADEIVNAAAKAALVAPPDIAPAMPQPAPASGDPVRKVAIDKLVPGKYQPRRMFREDTLDQLADSIAEHGILQPLLVRPLGSGKYEIIGGERRWRAAQRAKVHEVPVMIRDLTDSAALELGLIENLQREDLSAMEEAEGYQRLMDEFGYTQETVAHHLGRSRSQVANALRLLKLPAPVRDMVRSGALSAGHARTLVGAANAEDLADRIVRGGLSVRHAEKLAKQGATGKAARKPGTFRVKDVDILALEQKMTALLGLNVTIDGQGSAGRISVQYTSLDQLDDILERLSSAPGA